MFVQRKLPVAGCLGLALLLTAAAVAKEPNAYLSLPVVINEIMADNVGGVADAENGFDDWIELYNRSDEDIDLSGMYLSDSAKKLRKWRFPTGTVIDSGDYLLVWADEDGEAEHGLHANFKLAREGETLLFVDADERGNRILDAVDFGHQAAAVSLGRYPNGVGELQPLAPTPSEENQLNE